MEYAKSLGLVMILISIMVYQASKSWISTITHGKSFEKVSIQIDSVRWTNDRTPAPICFSSEYPGKRISIGLKHYRRVQNKYLNLRKNEDDIIRPIYDVWHSPQTKIMYAAKEDEVEFPLFKYWLYVLLLMLPVVIVDLWIIYKILKKN